MGLPPDLPIVDHHCHLSPTGDGVAAAQRFAKAGGTHLFLATQNYLDRPPLRLEEYEDQFRMTASLSEKVRNETGVEVFLVVAPFPVDLVGASEKLGVRDALELHQKALDLAGKWVRERKAVAIGEVGRPHFAVPRDVETAADLAFRHALAVARDSDCPAVVHSEDLNEEGYRALADLAVDCSFPSSRLVKHYARHVVPAVGRRGVAASYVARRDTVRDALLTDGPWFLETDYLDDPRRPGAVLDLATIPRRAASAAEEGNGERLRIPFVESVASVYGFEPTREGENRP